MTSADRRCPPDAAGQAMINTGFCFGVVGGLDSQVEMGRPGKVLNLRHLLRRAPEDQDLAALLTGIYAGGRLLRSAVCARIATSP
jgi:hypothetical protein